MIGIGRGCGNRVLRVKRVGGFYRLQRVGAIERRIVALTGMDVLIRHNDRERRIVFTSIRNVRNTVIVIIIARNFDRPIPIAPGSLHIRDRFGNGCTFAHIIPENFLKEIVAAKGNRLRIAVHHFDALGTHRLTQRVGRHTEADCHPKQTRRAVLGHMVGNNGAVDERIAFQAVHRTIGVVLIGQPIHRTQAEIRAGRAGNVVQFVIGIVIIRRAV